VGAVTGVRRLLTPASGLVGQGTRYALAGAFVGVVYVLTTTFFALVVGLPFREALIIGFALQLAVHFTLQRTFVWVHEEEFALPIRHQTRRYLAVAGLQLGLTTASTSLLPSVLGVSAEIVYLLTVALLTIANFLLFRNVVFHPTRANADSARAGVGPTRAGVDSAQASADPMRAGGDGTRAGAEIGI
jgi:putative flippase GtrA